MAGPIRVLMKGARFSVRGNAILSTWEGPPRKEHLDLFDQFMRELSARFVEGVAMFVVLEPGAMMTDAKDRRETEAAYTRWAGSLRAVAQVVEGGNLWASTARSIMTAIRLVDRKPYPIKVFSDIGEAARWCAPYLILPNTVKHADQAELLVVETRELRALHE
jgi:hypothetical protein